MTNDPPAVHLPTADVTDAMFIARPLYWLVLAVRELRFCITQDEKPVAWLIPVERDPNGIGDAA